MHTRVWLGALSCVAVLTASGPVVSAADVAPPQAGIWTDVQGTDDFLFDPAIPLDPLLAAIDCVQGQPTGNPALPCSPGSRVRIRELLAQSLFQTNDPRLSGVATIIASANFGPDYAGQVWGRWSLVVGGGAGFWEGSWQGTRTLTPGGNPMGGDAWTTAIRFIGFGSGSAAGLRVAASETVVTYTPLPIPYEALGFCVPGSCPPEGTIVGRIFDPPGRD